MGYKRPTLHVDGKQELVSRVVMSKKIGRRLTRQELVHHEDENPFNNDLGNLKIVSRAEHKRIHAAIGLSTRLQKRHHLESDLVIDLYKTKTSTEIAAMVGCSYKTITRLLKRHLSKVVDLRTLRTHAIQHGTQRRYAHQKEDLCLGIIYLTPSVDYAII